MPDTEMVKVADYCNVTKGKIGIKKALKGKYPLVTTAEERLSHNEYHFDRPSVIIPLVSSTGHGHASLKRIHYQEGKFAVGSILCAVTPKDENILNAQFLYHYLDVYKEKLLVSRMRGMANVTLPVTEIEDVEFPLLSTDKQKEWVFLFENTCLYTNSLTSEIDYQQSLLRKLRQSILQDAISGKLTEKWREENPDVESVTELLARIKTEKDRLVKEKKIKKPKPLPPITEDEIPFELPEGWGWCRLGEICVFITKGTTPKTNELKPHGDIPYLKVYNIINQKIDFHYRPQYISQEINDTILARSKVYPNDVLMNIVGPPLGKVALVPDTYKIWNINQALAIFRPVVSGINHFLYYFLCEGSEINKITTLGVVGQDNISLQQSREMIFPLPPQQEADTIVSKVEKLFTYCDELEQQICKSQQDSELLMQAVLKEAFEC